MRRVLLNGALFLPSRSDRPVPGPGEELAITTADGQRLHGRWIAADGPPRAHVLLCPGNGGHLADRMPYARLLSQAGFDVVLFDYRGYGRSSGRPSEAGTHRDARAVRAAVLRRRGVDPGRLIYLGESLGGAVALALALASPPMGLVLQSAFTSVRDVAHVHYPWIPRAVVPDAYPSIRLVPHLRAPLLVVHGRRDGIVPAAHGEALFAAAPEPKRLLVLPDAGHNDLLARAADRWIAAISSWAGGLAAGR